MRHLSRYKGKTLIVGEPCGDVYDSIIFNNLILTFLLARLLYKVKNGKTGRKLLPSLLLLVVGSLIVKLEFTELPTNMNAVEKAVAPETEQVPTIIPLLDQTKLEPGLGVYHKPVAELAERYLPGQITDLTGQSFQDVKTHLSDGRPVWVITNTTYKHLPANMFVTWHTSKGKINVTL